MLFSLMTLLAQAQDDAVPNPAKGDPQNPFGFLPVIVLMFAAFYFMIILPAQRKERKQRESLMTGIKKNDEVVTAGGIIGVVQTIKEGDEIVIKIDDNARMRVLKSSIVRIIPKETPAAAPPT